MRNEKKYINFLEMQRCFREALALREICIRDEENMRIH